mgnify:CR=1 FL=1
MDQTLLFTNSITTAIEGLVAEMAPATIHVVTDSIVAAKVLPSLGWKWPVITVPDGDMNKNLESLSAIWRGLIAQEATRRSLVICLGGGVVSDMGGFAAATFKRGVRFINVPTTLLSAVDAAVGGKTGINFDGLKTRSVPSHQLMPWSSPPPHSAPFLPPRLPRDMPRCSSTDC